MGLRVKARRERLFLAIENNCVKLNTDRAILYQTTLGSCDARHAYVRRLHAEVYSLQYWTARPTYNALTRQHITYYLPGFPVYWLRHAGIVTVKPSTEAQPLISSDCFAIGTGLYRWLAYNRDPASISAGQWYKIKYIKYWLGYTTIFLLCSYQKEFTGIMISENIHLQ